MAEAATFSPRSNTVLLLLTPSEAEQLRRAARYGAAEVAECQGGRAAAAVQRCIDALRQFEASEPVNSVFNLR